MRGGTMFLPRVLWLVGSFRSLNSLFFLPCFSRPVSNFTFTLPNCRSLIKQEVSVASSLRTHLCNSVFDASHRNVRFDDFSPLQEGGTTHPAQMIIRFDSGLAWGTFIQGNPGGSFNCSTAWNQICRPGVPGLCCRSHDFSPMSIRAGNGW